MTHHFMYPKVTPVRPGAGGPAAAASGSGTKATAPAPPGVVRPAV
jgi:hypothetical protein